MFDNIGGKIKKLAKVVCWIGIIASIIYGIILMATDGNLFFVGILTAVIGSLLSWVSSFILYGFGQLVENSDKIANSHHIQDNNKSVYSDAVTHEVTHTFRCDKCGMMISGYPCLKCGNNPDAVEE